MSSGIARAFDVRHASFVVSQRRDRVEACRPRRRLQRPHHRGARQYPTISGSAAGSAGLVPVSSPLRICPTAKARPQGADGVAAGRGCPGPHDATKDGFEVARAARAAQLPTALVFLTMHKDQHDLDAALHMGAKGYVLKDRAVSEIVGAIKAAAAATTSSAPPSRRS